MFKGKKKLFCKDEGKDGSQTEGTEPSQGLGSLKSPAESDGVTPTLIELYRRAAKCHEVLWRIQTKLTGNDFLPKQRLMVRHKLSVFPGFMTELT